MDITEKHIFFGKYLTNFCCTRWNGVHVCNLWG